MSPSSRIALLATTLLVMLVAWWCAAFVIMGMLGVCSPTARGVAFAVFHMALIVVVVLAERWRVRRDLERASPPPAPLPTARVVHRR